jgi:hypothetical protein
MIVDEKYVLEFLGVLWNRKFYMLAAGFVLV